MCKPWNKVHEKQISLQQFWIVTFRPLHAAVVQDDAFACESEKTQRGKDQVAIMKNNKLLLFYKAALWKKRTYYKISEVLLYYIQKRLCKYNYLLYYAIQLSKLLYFTVY